MSLSHPSFLFSGALLANAMTAKALQAEVAKLERTARDPIGALFALVQTSTACYSSPADGSAYARFTEALSLVPTLGDSAAGTVASVRESLRKNQFTITQVSPKRSSARDLAAALRQLASDGISLSEQGDASVLAAIERYQQRATRLTWRGLVLGLLVGIAGLPYVRRIESVNAKQYVSSLA